MEKYRGAGCGENNRNKPARQMALVSSQLLKQMFFLAGCSISLSPETPKIKHRDSPWRVKNGVFTLQKLLTSACCRPCKAPFQAKRKCAWQSVDCQCDKTPDGNQLKEGGFVLAKQLEAFSPGLAGSMACGQAYTETVGAHPLTLQQPGSRQTYSWPTSSH